MRIALDYTAGIRQGSGVGQYVRSLVNAMLAQDASNEYTLILTFSGTAGEFRFMQISSQDLQTYIMAWTLASLHSQAKHARLLRSMIWRSCNIQRQQFLHWPHI